MNLAIEKALCSDRPSAIKLSCDTAEQTKHDSGLYLHWSCGFQKHSCAGHIQANYAKWLKLNCHANGIATVDKYKKKQAGDVNIWQVNANKQSHTT